MMHTKDTVDFAAAADVVIGHNAAKVWQCIEVLLARSKAALISHQG